MSFHTNRTLLSATYSNFKADNKCDFKSNILHIFWYYSALLSSIFSTFWCFLDESVLFFTFFRYHFTQIAPYYRPLFRIFRPIRSVVLRVFFFIYYGIIPPYYRAFFRLFGPLISVILFFFPWKTRIVRFSAGVAFQLSVFFCRFHYLFFIFLGFRFSFFNFQFSFS